MNSADVQVIMIAFLTIFASFFVVFGGVKFVIIIFEKFIEDAFRKPSDGGHNG